VNGPADQALFRIRLPDGSIRLAMGRADGAPERLLIETITLDAILARGATGLEEALRDGASSKQACPVGCEILAPIESQEVWAAGVTYERSRDARMDESREPSIYDRVYEADRPELFLKAAGWRVRGPGQTVGIRVDSTWDVPEPELALVIAADGAIVGMTAGNDMSSRSIEGDNPLYLPQAKVYEGACALGPAIVALSGALPARAIGLEIERDGAVVVSERTSTANLHRTPEELAAWLFRALAFPAGAFLLTGTGAVPPPGFTLADGDVVRVSIDGVGSLENPVAVVGSAG
jgi:2-dehydro-3-deoxy-D-arabinonate dehydratase